MRAYKAVFLIVLCILSINLSGFSNENPSSAYHIQRVLFISSYNAGFDTLPDQIKGIQSVFDDTDVILDIDFMDTKQNDFEANFDNYYQFLKARLDHGTSYDVVIVGDDNGLQFLLDHRSVLFPQTPIVFFCINDLERAELANRESGITGIVEGISLEDNLALVKLLFPKVKNITAIVDNTSTGIGDAASFMAAAASHPEYTFSLLNASEYTFEDFGQALEQVDASTVLFYLSMFQDKTGTGMTIYEASHFISAHTSVPVLRMSIGGIGDGLLGGSMVSYQEQGRLAAQMARSILDGTDPDTIAMIGVSPNKSFFDYTVMARFGLTLRDLPEGAIVINRPPNLLETYWEILLPTVSIIVVLMVFVFILIRDNRMLKAKDLELSATNLELAAMYEEMAATEEELRYHYDQLSLSQQQLNESEARYRTLALTDALTGLNNRWALMKFLDELSTNQAQSWYLLFLDLDNFKDINDTRGHDIGDAILKEIGARLSTLLDDLIYLSRLGGDEFVAIVPGEAYALDRVLQAVETRLLEVIRIDNAEFYLSGSIGISYFPKDGHDKTLLLRKADLAMYEAKAKGKNMYAFYNESMEIATKHRWTILNRLRHALENNAFELFLQPQKSLIDNHMTGVEMLIRWRDAQGNFISPDQFIPIAEELGIIKAIGKWVYEEAAHMASQWERQYGVPLKYSVNASAVELMNSGFAESFLKILAAYGIQHENVALEITESSLISSKEAAIVQIQILKQTGIEIHLDDFGTGYSSLNYLQSLPLDVLKIDRQFILNLAISEKNRDMLRFIIEIAHNLKLIVIAEGVENQSQYAILKALGCDEIQGYYYSKPLSFDDFKQFLNISEH